VIVSGAAQVMCGDPRLQVTSSQLGLPGITAVTDLASAERALDTIVTQGEGAPHCPGHSHYSRFLAIRNELEAVLAADPADALENLAVAAMDAVEVADGQRDGAVAVGGIREPTK